MPELWSKQVDRTKFYCLLEKVNGGTFNLYYASFDGKTARFENAYYEKYGEQERLNFTIVKNHFGKQLKSMKEFIREENEKGK